MSNLELLVGKRKFIRSNVTRNFNNKDNFVALGTGEKHKLKLLFDSWSNELSDLDSQILELRFATWTVADRDANI